MSPPAKRKIVILIPFGIKYIETFENRRKGKETSSNIWPQESGAGIDHIADLTARASLLAALSGSGDLALKKLVTTSKMAA